MICSTAVRLVTEGICTCLLQHGEHQGVPRGGGAELDGGVWLGPRGGALDHLLSCLEELEDRMEVAGNLWERGILMTNEPLEAHNDDP